MELLEIIYTYGEARPDCIRCIKFGKLFQLYTKISNKVVGMCMRARKHGLVKFEGEMLWQRRDEEVDIRLVALPETVAKHLGVKVEGQKTDPTLNR